MDSNINVVMQALEDLGNDDVPKNVREKVAVTMRTLQGNNGDGIIRVSRALQELEGIAEDNNLDAFARSKLFNIVSLLESATLNSSGR